MSRESIGSIKWMRNVKTGKMQSHARFSRGPGRNERSTCRLTPTFSRANREGTIADAARWVPEARVAIAPGGSVETVEAYAKRCLADRAERVVSAKDDNARLRDTCCRRSVPSRCGGLPGTMSPVRDALDAKVRDGEMSWKTARNIWTVLLSFCDALADARWRELRVRKDNPAAGIRPPIRLL